MEDRKALVDNSADAQQVRAAEKRSRYERRQLLDDVRQVLAVPAGLRLMKHYLAKCGVFRASPNGSELLHRSAGQRDIGLMILSDVGEADPDAFARMFRNDKETEVRDAR